MNQSYDVIIIGAGAAGLMCAIESGKRGRKVCVLEHSKKIAEKIRISGGGRSNFANLHSAPDKFISQNKNFCRSALERFTQNDFIDLVKKHGIDFHEKKLGQLFCDKSAEQIIKMLLKECHQANVKIKKEIKVENIVRNNNGYSLTTSNGIFTCQSLVIASGGLSIPKIGASKFGYDVARQFGLNVIETRAGLVPLTFQAEMLDFCKNLTGLSVEAKVTCGKVSFSEGLLFTHRGLSGPSILQISSYWREGNEIIINLSPQIDMQSYLLLQKNENSKTNIQTVIAHHLPKRLAASICEQLDIKGRIAEISNKHIQILAQAINNWKVKPSGTEGYRTAEVTLGGVDTKEISPQTMEAIKQPGLFFVGEVIDVTGHLGGHNFQWAWSSGYVCGQYA